MATTIFSQSSKIVLALTSEWALDYLNNAPSTAYLNSYMYNELVIRPQELLGVNDSMWVTFSNGTITTDALLMQQREITASTTTAEMVDASGNTYTVADTEVTGYEYFILLPQAVLQNVGQWQVSVEVRELLNSNDATQFSVIGTSTIATFNVNNSLSGVVGDIPNTIDIATLYAQAISTAGKTPYIGDNDNWFVWNSATQQFEDSGVSATGDTGTPAGFGDVTATAQTLAPDQPATVEVVASGDDTAKNFAFTFGIPKGEPGDVSSTGTYPDMTVGKAISDGNGNNIVNTYAPKNTIYRPNLVINGGFEINQRRATSITDGYTLDRWSGFESVAGTINSDGSISITSSAGYLAQLLETGTVVDGETYTLSLKVNGTVYSGTVTTGTTDGILLTVNCGTGLAILARVTQTNFTYAVGMTGTLTNIEWVKLEQGDYPTPYVKPDYNTELLRCQRYFVQYSGNGTYVGTGYSFNATGAYILTPLPTNMRTRTPTVTLTDCYLSSANHQASNSILTGDITDTVCAGNILKLAISAEGLTGGEFNMLAMRSSISKMTIDGEL